MIRLIKSELLKLTTTTWFKVAVTSLLGVSALSAVLNARAKPLGGRIDSTANLHHVLTSSAYTSMGLLAIGISIMGSEYRHHTAVPTFLVSPKRSTVVVAKLVTGVVVGAVVGALAFGFAVASATVALGSRGVHHFAGDTAQMWIGAAVATAIYGALGVALGAIARNMVLAIVAALVWVQVVEVAFLAATFPSIGKWMPTGANLALTRTATNPHELLSPLVAVPVLLVWTAALGVTARTVVVQRDV